ncbi:alpha/beta-hydrolase [Panus rudis PR-1116 ss-1]|nr:alpha/beta-hydrolase [Panus rudis PR-1116 ss-1]
MPSLEDIARGTVAATAGLSTVAAGLLYYGQNYLIYPSAFPPGSRTEVPTPDQYGLPYHALELNTPDNVKLQCYLLVQTKELSLLGVTSIPVNPETTDDDFAASRPTVIMFHGNGGNIGHRIPLARVFFAKLRCNVLMVSYRGYGLSEGSPSEKGLKQDAQAALDYVKSHPILSKGPTILYGQSIGGAVAIDLASRNPASIDALILENTFLSLPRLVPSAIPALGPFAFLCHQKWDSASKIHLIPPSTPILMLSGKMDEVVPREHMLGLWELVQQRESMASTGTGMKSSPLRRSSSSSKETSTEGVPAAAIDPRSPSKFLEFEHGTHNDTCVQPGYWSAVAEFIASLGDPVAVSSDVS